MKKGQSVFRRQPGKEDLLFYEAYTSLTLQRMELFLNQLNTIREDKYK